MKLLIMMNLILGFNLYAQDSLDKMKVSKEEIYKSLEIMKKEGKISETDYLKSKKELKEMDQAQIEGLNQKAVGIVKKDPDKAKKIYKDMQQEFDKLSK